MQRSQCLPQNRDCVVENPHRTGALQPRASGLPPLPLIRAPNSVYHAYCSKYLLILTELPDSLSHADGWSNDSTHDQQKKIPLTQENEQCQGRWKSPWEIQWALDGWAREWQIIFLSHLIFFSRRFHIHLTSRPDCRVFLKVHGPKGSMLHEKQHHTTHLPESKNHSHGFITFQRICY